MSQNVGNIYKNRRQTLIDRIKKEHSNKKCIVILFGSFENKRCQFRQNSTFYYFSGLTEPALVSIIDLDNKFTVYVPAYGESRLKWIGCDLANLPKEKLNNHTIDKIELLGKECKGYIINQECAESTYENLIKYLSDIINSGYYIFTDYSKEQYSVDNLILEKLCDHVRDLRDKIIDITSIIANLRRTKSQYEIELIYKAVETTMAAHAAIAGSIEPNTPEYVVKAGAEFVFGTSNATCAFPSIVATGANAAVLHYAKCDSILKNGELVLVDIGAESDYYCGDLTRTYPVTGKFNARQKELYNIVLQTQLHVVAASKPGYWIRNNENPEKSLHHIALAFLQKKGYEQYFTHSIGHYLGLDVHDVGSYSEPLKEGDIITIEPGIYIPKEKIGIRIEDNYWILADGNVCLSEDLPKTVEAIEELMVSSEDEDFEEELEYND